MPSEHTIEELNRRLREAADQSKSLREQNRNLDTRPQQHVAGPLHVRCGRTACALQSALPRIMDLSASLRARTLQEMITRRHQSGAEAATRSWECEEILAAIAAGKAFCIWWRRRRSYRARRQPPMAGGGWVRPSTHHRPAAG